MVRRKRREVVEAARNEKILASGRPLEPQMRTEPRTEVNARIDPYKIRSGAYKMVLPPEEEAKLTLVRAQVPKRMCVCQWGPAFPAPGSCAPCMGCKHVGPCPTGSNLYCSLKSLHNAWRLHGALWQSQSPHICLILRTIGNCPHTLLNPVQDQLGTGIQLSPKWPWGYLFGGKEDFVFGIFGRTNHAQAALERRWASARRLHVLFICAQPSDTLGA